MPKITYNDDVVECNEGDNLRQVLIENDMTPHKGIAKSLNCRGNGTCGTCAVRITEGPVREDEQATRLKFATHDNMEEVRLACQYEVTEDLVIEKP